MPVIVVGADTPTGSAIADALIEPGREVRVFVSDQQKAAAFRQNGVKVALGDVSDESHIEAAAVRCFSAVLVAEAATDSRERAFAKTPAQVLQSWASAVRDVQRVIWITADEPPPVKVQEVAVVDPSTPNLATTVFELDAASAI